MAVTTVLRGFNFPLSVPDAFLLAHDVHESKTLCASHASVYEKDPDEVCTLLRGKVGSRDSRTRIFAPYRLIFDLAFCAYVACDCIMVLAQRNIKPVKLSDTTGSI